MPKEKFDIDILPLMTQSETRIRWTNKEIRGGNGNDTLDGTNTSHDSIYGGGGNDGIYGYLGLDKLYGGNGNDFLYGGGNADLLYGGSGNDRLDGGQYHDKLYGGSGADILLGGSGSDIIDGGAGRDIMYGGSGSDTFYFDIKGGDVSSDTIWDYSDEDLILVDDLDLVMGLYQFGSSVAIVVEDDSYYGYELIEVKNTTVDDINIIDQIVTIMPLA